LIEFIKKFFPVIIALFLDPTIINAMDTLHANEAERVCTPLYYDPVEEERFMGEIGLQSLPATANFVSQNSHQLCFVAPAHSSDKASPTFQIIEQQVREFRPTFMILEGFSNSEASIRNISESCFREGVLEEPSCGFWGEPHFAVYLALKHRIPFVSGEPRMKDEVAFLLYKNFTEEEIAYFYLIRQTQQYYCNNSVIGEGPIELYFNSICQPCASNVSTIGGEEWLPQFGCKYSFNGCKSWFMKTYERPLTLAEWGSFRIYNPKETSLTLYKLYVESMYFRDLQILKVTQNAMSTHARVLVVYGASHYYTQHKALESFFDKPKYNEFKGVISCDSLL
jgi:hypothetical protein